MTVALYVRVSTHEQAEEGYSIEQQTERLKMYAKAHDWNIYKIYTDPGFTGSNMERPALLQMLQDAAKGLFQILLVYKLDRLSRSQKDTLTIIEEKLLPNGCDFVSMSENFDTTTPLGKAMIGILAVFAQLEREQIKERMVMGREARAKKGLWHGGGEAPFGYIYKDHQLIINDYEAMIVRRIFDLAHEGKSYHLIAQILNDEGYRTRETIWTGSTVRKIINKKVYAGLVSFGEDTYEGVHDPIIDPERFNEVQKIKRIRTKDWNDNGYNSWKATSCISGLVYCARCGRKYYIRTNKCIKNNGKYQYIYKRFMCDGKDGTSNDKPVEKCKNKSWKKEKLIDLVLGEIRKLALDPDSIDKISDQPARKDDSKILKAEIKKIDAQISKLMDLYALESMPFEAVKAKIDSLSEKKGALQAKIQKTKDDAQRKKNLKLIKKSFKQIPIILDNGTEEEIREIVLELIKKIEIDGDDVAIYWNF